MLTGTLWKWNDERSLNAFSSGDISELSLPVKVMCIGGLTDGLNACPWIFRLSTECRERGWNVVQPLLSSSYLGYGTGSLVRDTSEIVKFIEHLVSNHGCEHIVWIGHSTGCQNAIHFLNHAPPSVKSRVIAVVLQAPVSDQEAGEMEEGHNDYLEYARQELRANGESACDNILMPMHMHYSPITVSRFLSLFDKYGMDDMFSSYLTDYELKQRLQCFSAADSSSCGDVSVLIAYSLADEFVPNWIDKHKLVSRLACAMGPTSKVLLLEGANHNLSIPADGAAIELFVEHAVDLIDSKLRNL